MRQLRGCERYSLFLFIFPLTVYVRRYHPISRAQFDEEVFSKIYAESSTPTPLSPNSNSFNPPSPPSSILSPTSPDSRSTAQTSEPAPYAAHRLALLFAVLAVGTLVDLNQRAHAPQAKTYYNLARAALAVENVLEEPSVVAIQALVSIASSK